jgi:hypothetical protein
METFVLLPSRNAIHSSKAPALDRRSNGHLPKKPIVFLHRVGVGREPRAIIRQPRTTE